MDKLDDELEGREVKDSKRQTDDLEQDKDSDTESPKDIDVNTYYISTKHVIINLQIIL